MKKQIFAFILSVSMCLSLTGCAHFIHLYDPTAVPTCAEPVRCKYCDKIEVEAPHNFGATPISVVEATCTTPGSETYACEVCGFEETRETPTSSHREGEPIIAVQATLDPGTLEYHCVDCGALIRTEQYELSSADQVQYIQSECAAYTYDEIARNPDNYKGKMATFTGEVIQVLENNNELQMRVNITLTGSEYYQYYTDTIFVRYTLKSGEGRILENDILTMYGVMDGTVTYDSIFGQQITIPSFNAYVITIN